MDDMEEFPPEYVNASNAARIVSIVGVFHLIAFTFVALRTYVRVFLVRSFGVDDGLIIVVGILALVSWICLILQIPYGLGRHGLVVPVEDRIKFERITFWKTVLSDGVALGLLRLSMALSLLRLKRDLKWYRWSLFGLMGFVVAYSIQSIVWLFVYCTPFSGWWEFQWMNPFDPRCHDFTIFVNLVYWNISCHIFTDVLLGALPIPIIWNLKMKLRQRLYVIAILNLGYFAVLMGILKAVFMLTTGGDPDQIFDYWVHFWQNLQLNIGIMAACASFLKPLVGRVLKINSSAAGYYSSNQQYNRSGRNTTGPGTLGRSRTGLADEDLADGFELRDNKNASVSKQAGATVTGEPGGAGRSRTEYENGSAAETVYACGVSSDANSEEIILQKGDQMGGIMRRTEYTVDYSSTGTSRN